MGCAASRSRSAAARSPPRPDAPGCYAPRSMSSAPPDDAARLAAAERAFEAGDFARARSVASALAHSSDDDIRRRAETLAARLRVDPVQVGVLVACTLFFAWVVARYVF